MNFLTDFADQAVVLPFALVVAATLAIAGWWRGTLAWVLAVSGVLGTILVLKLVFAACAAQLDPSGIVSPSGHTASACVVYGGLAVLLLRGRVPGYVTVLLPLCIAAVFGVSRLVLHAHTPGDVAVGTVIGMAGVALLTALAGPRPVLRPWPLGLAALTVIVVFHGLRMPAEAAIYRVALSGWLPFLAACRA
jgi:membrane-associated phospholipid phosphatase